MSLVRTHHILTGESLVNSTLLFRHTRLGLTVKSVWTLAGWMSIVSSLSKKGRDPTRDPGRIAPGTGSGGGGAGVQGYDYVNPVVESGNEETDLPPVRFLSY